MLIGFGKSRQKSKGLNWNMAKIPDKTKKTLRKLEKISGRPFTLGNLLWSIRKCEELTQEAVFTVQPKGILVIGHTNQLDTTDCRNSFELFRRNLTNPEILTFDELYKRARFIVEHSETAE